ncbi:hypothetical protein Fmac_006036 [Flemingia macrophylla]|uniref:Uncharacterized protein n=1 Tax=Flemingia macrophylla TaxID=520843 RepID=A0ABD1N9G7_9FABA
MSSIAKSFNGPKVPSSHTIYPHKPINLPIDDYYNDCGSSSSVVNDNEDYAITFFPLGNLNLLPSRSASLDTDLVYHRHTTNNFRLKEEL